MPLQSCCFAHKINCFLKLLSSSCLLKLLNVSCGQVLVSQSTLNHYLVAALFCYWGVWSRRGTNSFSWFLLVYSSNLHNSSSDWLMRFGRFGNSYSITEFADNNRLGRFRLNRRRYFDSTCELFPDQFYLKFCSSKRRWSSFFSSKRVF